MIAGATIKFGFNQIFDANTGKLVTFANLAWPGDGKTLISGSEDGRARIWTTWQQIGELTGDTGVVYDIAVSPNGCILASTHLGNTARLWNLENGQPIRSPLQLQMMVISRCPMLMLHYDLSSDSGMLNDYSQVFSITHLIILLPLGGIAYPSPPHVNAKLPEAQPHITRVLFLIIPTYRR
ncbi:hypothetical protein M405DRAFT_810616 [Rhizopogon salebrosus TDB-379]|nr:hypothetical protein M405DRAFT_810616 [Rhizopogon salebrosus TDB-379]